MCGVMMVAAAVHGAASAIDPQNPKIVVPQDEVSRRPPLLPSEKDNSNGIANGQKRLKSRVVSSRYMSSPSTSTSTSTSNSSSLSSSSSSCRRLPSPLISRKSAAASTASLGFRRSVSVDRRRPAPAGSSTPDVDFKPEVSAASKLLVTSTRSLSVSFQGEAFSLPISKTKVAPTSPNLGSARKGTPERRRTVTPVRGKADLVGDQVENSRPVDQHRWPGRTRGANLLSRSLDCSGVDGERSKLTGSGNSIHALQQSMINERRPSLDRRPSLRYSELPKVVRRDPDGNSVNAEASGLFDHTASDSDSASSGSTSGVQEFRGADHGQSGPDGIIVSARFWQETNRRLRRLQDPGSPLSSSPGSKLIAPPKLKRYTNEGSLPSPQTPCYPIRGGIRSPSPSKLMTPVASSPSRGHSPSRIRNVVSTISNTFSETPSVLSFVVDVRRGKVGENKIIDAHLLRLLYNRHLQWRFVTARTEAVLLVQRRRAEKNLWNAWITISDLCDCLTKKRHRLQLLRQKLKLVSILKGQTTLLEDWAFLDKDHLISLLGAIKSLKASTLRLPVDGGASVDIQSLQDAIRSSVDIMQAMAASVHMLLPPVEEVNGLVTELAKVTTKERAVLDRCTDSIFQVAALQVKDSSLRTHLLQHHDA